MLDLTLRAAMATMMERLHNGAFNLTSPSGATSSVKAALQLLFVWNYRLGALPKVG